MMIKLKNPFTSFGTITVVGLLLLIGLVIWPNFDTEVLEITVKNTERITTGTGENLSSKYLVFTESEVFENSDALLHGKFNSSDFQNKLKLSQSYKVKVAGWRVPFLSMYRNIVDIY